jgi:hypothetical protein
MRPSLAVWARSCYCNDTGVKRESGVEASAMREGSRE